MLQLKASKSKFGCIWKIHPSPPSSILCHRCELPLPQLQCHGCGSPWAGQKDKWSTLSWSCRRILDSFRETSLDRGRSRSIDRESTIVLEEARGRVRVKGRRMPSARSAMCPKEVPKMMPLMILMPLVHCTLYMKGWFLSGVQKQHTCGHSGRWRRKCRSICKWGVWVCETVSAVASGAETAPTTKRAGSTPINNSD